MQVIPDFGLYKTYLGQVSLLVRLVQIGPEGIGQRLFKCLQGRFQLSQLLLTILYAQRRSRPEELALCKQNLLYFFLRCVFYCHFCDL